MATAKPYHVNWPTGADQMLIVSVGTGSAPNVQSEKRCDDLNLIHFAKNVRSALDERRLRRLGYDLPYLGRLSPRRPYRPGDRRYGECHRPDDPNWTGPKLFTYLRYDPNVTFEGLKALGLTDIDPAKVQVLDSVDHIPDIRRVGIVYAAQHVKIEHFRGFVS